MKRWLMVLAVAGMALGFGCTTDPYAGQADNIKPGAYPNITLEDEDLRDGLLFGRAVVTPGTDAKPMSVVQPGRNTEDYGISVQYRYEFFDRAGRPARTNQSQGWRYLTMPPKIEVFFEGMAMDTDAADWRLIVRPAR